LFGSTTTALAEPVGRDWLAANDVIAMSPARSRTRRWKNRENENMDLHLVGCCSLTWETPGKFRSALKLSDSYFGRFFTTSENGRKYRLLVNPML
jgi:hypothetical protein